MPTKRLKLSSFGVAHEEDGNVRNAYSSLPHSRMRKSAWISRDAASKSPAHFVPRSRSSAAVSSSALCPTRVRRWPRHAKFAGQPAATPASYSDVREVFH